MKDSKIVEFPCSRKSKDSRFLRICDRKTEIPEILKYLENLKYSNLCSLKFLNFRVS